MVDFFNPACRIETEAAEFGIIDPQPAAISFSKPENWICLVRNPELKAVVFTAIDKCIPFTGIGQLEEKRCDGMLTLSREIIFIELKEKQTGWIPRASEQVAHTIEVFRANHDLWGGYDHRRAYLCNRKAKLRQLDASHHAMRKRFLTEYLVVLEIDRVIDL
jgi:hypothetical protein